MLGVGSATPPRSPSRRTPKASPRHIETSDSGSTTQQLRSPVFSNDTTGMMDQILSPSMVDPGDLRSMESSSEFSAEDSILQRVEREIAAARQAAAVNRSIPAEWTRHPSLSPKRKSSIDEDMHDILNTTTTDEDFVVANRSVDGSFNDAMNVIDDEFEELRGMGEEEENLNDKDEGVVADYPVAPLEVEYSPKERGILSSWKLHRREEEVKEEKEGSEIEETMARTREKADEIEPVVVETEEVLEENAETLQETAVEIITAKQSSSSAPDDEWTREASGESHDDEPEAAAQVQEQVEELEVEFVEEEDNVCRIHPSPSPSVRLEAEEDGVEVVAEGLSVLDEGSSTNEDAEEDSDDGEFVDAHEEQQVSRCEDAETDAPMDEKEATLTGGSPQRDAQNDNGSLKIPKEPTVESTPTRTETLLDELQPVTKASTEEKTDTEEKEDKGETEESNRKVPVMDWAILADDTKSTISDRINDEPDSTVKSPRSYKEYVTSKLKGKSFEGKSKSPDENDDISTPRQPRKIRFRKPFPILKPAPGPRPDQIIIREHSLGLPDAHIRWIKPKPELKKLIVAAMGTSLQRRTNACGALKVLTVKKKNQLTLARTDGFLTALLFTASQAIPHSDRDLAVDARCRAVACLRSVATPKENRVVVLSHPGVIECFSSVLIEDQGEARANACASLALLAKSVECREGLAENLELVDAMALILSGDADLASRSLDMDSGHQRTQSSGRSLSEHSDASNSDDERSACSESSEESGSKQSKSLHGPPAIARVDSIRNRHEDMQYEYEKQAMLNACAFLLHLSKHCAVLGLLVENEILLNSLIKVSIQSDNPLHTRCLEIIRNLTLLPGNNSRLTRHEGIIDAIVISATSSIPEDRILALRALQNMSSDRSSRALLATRPVLALVTSAAMRRDPSEKEAAVATLYNITTEPSAVVAITNTENVIATLVHLAHSPLSSSTIRALACEALATTSLWLQTLAGTGRIPEGLPDVLLPSHRTYGWERWD